MSDPFIRRPRRTDSRQWDEPDRKPRGGDREHQRDRPRDHRARDHGGGRNDYDRSGRDRRRYRSRSRSRERRDPDRLRSRSRERRHSGRDDDRERERDRVRDDRRGGRRGGREDMERPRDEPDADPAPKHPNLDGGRKKHDDHSRRRSASPRRSPSPRSTHESADHPADGADYGYLDTLPTRTRPDRHKHAAMSFRVGGNPGSPRDSDRRGRSRSRSRDRGDAMDLEDGERSDGDDPEVVVEDDGMADMAAMMGFGGFGTTKNKKVAGNNAGAVRKEKSTKYRQYMNRAKGFNRPLSPTR